MMISKGLAAILSRLRLGWLRIEIGKSVTRKLIVLMLMIMNIGTASAEVSLTYAASSLPYPTTWQQVPSRNAACPAWEAYQNGLYGFSFSDPRQGKWWDPGSQRYFPGGWQFSCFYTYHQKPYDGGQIIPNNERWVGWASCGGIGYGQSDPKYAVDIVAERCVCNTGITSTAGQCVSSLDPGQIVIGRVAHGGKNNGPQKEQCGIGNPVMPSTGNKFQQELIWRIGHGLDLLLTYNYNDNQYTSFGRRWRSPFDRMIQIDDGGSAIAFRQDGKAFRFVKSGSVWNVDIDINDKLQEILNVSAQRTGWQFKNTADDSIETYDVNGKLVSIQKKDGLLITLQYSDGTAGTGGDFYLDGNGNATTAALAPGRLIKVTNSLGRTIRFRYNVIEKIAQAIDSSGAIYKFNYDAVMNLSSIVFPDNKVRTYLYNEQVNTSNTDLPSALTGIIDENGNRFATFFYGSNGKAISTEHAGGVEKYSISYTSPGVQSTVTDPLGSVRTYNFTTILGVVKPTGQSQPGGSGCGPAASAITYDANGNVASRTDFNGVVTTYTYDLTRNLETSRTEASGTAQARTITTTWHSSYRLPLVVAEPLRRTSYTYDANGNQLTRTIQATSDTTGAQGVNGTAVGTARIWTYTYNSVGQVLTATGPRTDIVDTTSYVYDAMGNLISVTNALNQTTLLSNYDLNGRVGKITDSNGTVTDLTYSPRGWLTSKITTAGTTTEATSYSYDGVGQLTKVTLPDGVYIDYSYDAAHRLTGMTDSAGNSIVYTLDAMGNRTNEQVKDPSGQLAKQTTRVIDALNRIQQITGPGSAQ
ncbi:putative deoxyribonuclease RhsB [compost metagenome]